MKIPPKSALGLILGLLSCLSPTRFRFYKCNMAALFILFLRCSLIKYIACKCLIGIKGKNYDHILKLCINQGLLNIPNIRFTKAKTYQFNYNKI
jgi:hypothetical protein